MTRQGRVLPTPAGLLKVGMQLPYDSAGCLLRQSHINQPARSSMNHYQLSHGSASVVVPDRWAGIAAVAAMGVWVASNAAARQSGLLGYKKHSSGRMPVVQHCWANVGQSSSRCALVSAVAEWHHGHILLG